MSKPKIEKTLEQIAAQKLKRQQYYKNIDPEKKAAIIAKQIERNNNRTAEQIAAYRAKQRVPKELQGGQLGEILKDFVLHDDVRGDINIHPSWTPTLTRLDKKVKAHKKAWATKCERIVAWEKAGGWYPSPNIQDKIETTELFAKIMHIKGRRCVQCGTHDMHDFNWRITRKDDFWAFVPFQKSAYQTVFRNLDKYDIYCPICAFDISLFTFYWVFGPKSPRLNPGCPEQDIGGPKYQNWNKIWPTMYPVGNEALMNKIRRGAIKSISCQMINGKGQQIDSIIRKKKFHSDVKLEPRDFHCLIMEEVGQLYIDNFPKGFWKGVGWDPPMNNIGRSRERNPKLMSDDLKNFILTVPMGPHIQWGGTWNVEPPPTPVPEKDLQRRGWYY